LVVLLGFGVSNCFCEKSIEDLHKAAEQGDVDAQYNLGMAYLDAKGVPKNETEALKWFLKAAKKGHVQAQSKLGYLYSRRGLTVESGGNDVPADLAEARKWYRKAAEQGDAEAQIGLGFSYLNQEKNVPRNVPEALKWIRKAAEQGHPYAMYELGEMYLLGRDDVPKDVDKGVKWMRRAAEQGYTQAQYRLGSLYLNTIMSRLEGGSVPKDVIEGAKWLRKAAENGHTSAMFELGQMYEQGKGVPKDFKEAAKWYRGASEDRSTFSSCGGAAAFSLGLMYEDEDPVEAAKWFHKAAELITPHRPAEYKLGLMYEEGRGVPKDDSEAAKRFRIAAEGGHMESQFKLGLMFYQGKGVPKDETQAVKWISMAAVAGLDEAIKWIRTAAEQGDAEAQFNLGRAYQRGEGVPKNFAEALKWYRKAADQGNAKAQNNLGAAYTNGTGVPKDHTEAVKWYRKAAEQGHVTSQRNLALSYNKGEGVPKDEIEALAWFNIAAATGDQNAATSRGALEKQLGRQASLLSQQRSKEIIKDIELARQKRAKTEEPGQKPPQPAEGNAELKGSGTGVFVTSDGLILTAAHVVAEAGALKVITKQGLKVARVVKVDASNDLALLKCDGNFQAVPVKPSSGIKLGRSVFTIGFPNIEFQGFSPKMTKGEISSLSGLQDDSRHWQISVPVQPGNSGGPLFDEAGNVVGVVLAKLDAIKVAKATGDLPQNVSYAIKSIYALPLLEPYIANLASESGVWSSLNKLENVVEKVQGAVVLIVVY
jgi:TPR repeat protein